jgi:hypothetical protein
VIAAFATVGAVAAFVLVRGRALEQVESESVPAA